MAIERKESGVDAWFRAWETRDFTALAAMYHPEARYERPDGRASGVDEIITYLRALAAAAPHATATVEAAHFAPEAVTVEWTERQPDGESDRLVDVFQVHGGRIVAQRQYVDPTRRMRLLAAYAARTLDLQHSENPDRTMVGFGRSASDDPGATMVAGHTQDRFAGGTGSAPMPGNASHQGTALRIDSGPDQGVLLAIGKGVFTIGRALDNRLVVRDPATSLHHAEIQCGDGELLVTDLESTNGTFVNGERIRQRRLTDGDRLGIGQNALTLVTSLGSARQG